MKYKILTKEQIIISLDRLTRFKNTKEKYLRVYSDILQFCLIEPKIKKSDIENMDYEIVTNYVSEIFNASLDIYQIQNSSNNKYNIVEFLRDYENSVFINDEDTQKLLNNNIDYKKAIELLKEDSPINLKWLKEVVTNFDSQANYEDLKQLRSDNKLKYPIEEVILVEGITEEILLPVFARLLGYDFYAKGIQVIPAGGKNQVVKMYYKLCKELKIPIFVLLDKDAEDNIKQITPKLRSIDRIHLVSCGEFEDLLPKSLIVKAVNSHFKNFLAITEADLESTTQTAKALEEIFKTKGLHEFKKAEFAKLVKDLIDSENDVSSEIRAIIDEIRV